MLTFSADSKHVDGKSRTTSEDISSKEKMKSEGMNKKVKIMRRVLTLSFPDSSSRSHKKKKSKDKDRQRDKVSWYDLHFRKISYDFFRSIKENHRLHQNIAGKTTRKIKAIRQIPKLTDRLRLREVLTLTKILLLTAATKRMQARKLSSM